MAERTARDLIDEWRALERELSRLDPDGTYYDSVHIKIQRLRREYQRVCANSLATLHQLRAASRDSVSRVARSAQVSEMARVQLRQIPDSVGAYDSEA